MRAVDDHERLLDAALAHRGGDLVREPVLGEGRIREDADGVEGDPPGLLLPAPHEPQVVGRRRKLSLAQRQDSLVSMESFAPTANSTVRGSAKVISSMEVARADEDMNARGARGVLLGREARRGASEKATTTEEEKAWDDALGGVGGDEIETPRRRVARFANEPTVVPVVPHARASARNE